MAKYKCVICNKLIFDRPSHKRITCSLFCRNKKLSNNKGFKSPIWIEKIEKKCNMCGKNIYCLPLSNQKFCSQLCANKNKSLLTKGKQNTGLKKWIVNNGSWNKGIKLPHFSGKNNPRWKGGMHLNEGYRYLF